MIRQPFSLGGIISIAGFIKYKNRFNKDKNILSQNTSVLILHGNKDDVISSNESKISHKLFIDSGYKSELHILPANHKIPLQETKLIKKHILDKSITQ